jgi:hypothetical protein
MLDRVYFGAAARGVGIAQTAQGLGMIAKPGCAAAIWRPAPQPAFWKWIDGLKPDRLPVARQTLRPDIGARGPVRSLQARRNAGATGFSVPVSWV